MAKLFIGCDYIDFTHGNSPYKGIMSKIVLADRIIFRIDYTCQQSFQTDRYEVSYQKDTQSDRMKWVPYTDVNKELAAILNSHIENNKAVLQLD